MSRHCLEWSLLSESEKNRHHEYLHLRFNKVSQDKKLLYERLMAGHKNSHPDHFIENTPLVSTCSSCSVLVATGQL